MSEGYLESSSSRRKRLAGWVRERGREWERGGDAEGAMRSVCPLHTAWAGCAAVFAGVVVANGDTANLQVIA